MKRLLTRGVIALAAGATVVGVTTSAVADNGPAATRLVQPMVTAALLLPDGPTHSTAVLGYIEGGTAPATARTSFTNLLITRTAGDPTTAFLIASMVGRRQLANGLALTVTPSGQQRPQMKITLGRPQVVSDTIAGSNGQKPTESVSFSFASVMIEVYTQNGSGGVTTSKACFNSNTEGVACPPPVN